MMIGIIGRMRSGKTLLQSILADYLRKKTELELHANYPLKNSSEVKTTKDIWRLNNCIFCFDEIWMTMDSRFWKDNASLSYWIMQTRKRGVMVFYTAQHRSEIEKRVRLATDLFIFCEHKKINNKNAHKYTFLEPDLMNEDKFLIGRSYLLLNPEIWYSLYDSFKLMWPITYVKMSENEIKQISESN
jgi:hypothetical protein